MIRNEWGKTPNRYIYGKKTNEMLWTERNKTHTYRTIKNTIISPNNTFERSKKNMFVFFFLKRGLYLINMFRIYDFDILFRGE